MIQALNPSGAEVDGVAQNTLVDYLVRRVVELSTNLDHISTIPHGINHVMVVTTLMNEVIPSDIRPLQEALVSKYGRYAEVLNVLTAICHDLGYASLAKLPIVFPAQIFGSDHCRVGADIFRNEIAPLVREAFPDIPEEYLEDVESTIGDHGRKFSSESPLNAEENPLLFLLLLADKSDRVGVRRLHAVHQNRVFYDAIKELAESIQEPARQYVDRVIQLERRLIPAVIAELGGEIPDNVISFHKLLENQLKELPSERDSQILSSVVREDELGMLLLERFRKLYQIDMLRWRQGGELPQILVELNASEEIAYELKLLAIGYLLHPFSPFGLYGTLVDDIDGFLGVENIDYYYQNNRAYVVISTCSSAGNRVAGRFQKGLRGLHIDGEELVIC